jgi:hypothetical protein
VNRDPVFIGCCRCDNVVKGDVKHTKGNPNLDWNRSDVNTPLLSLSTIIKNGFRVNGIISSTVKQFISAALFNGKLDALIGDDVAEEGDGEGDDNTGADLIRVNQLIIQ